LGSQEAPDTTHSHPSLFFLPMMWHSFSLLLPTVRDWSKYDLWMTYLLWQLPSQQTELLLKHSREW